MKQTQAWDWSRAEPQGQERCSSKRAEHGKAGGVSLGMENRREGGVS